MEVVIAEYYANHFINVQVNKEKESHKWIKPLFIRDLSGFKYSNYRFLKENLYYSSQKVIIHSVIIQFCKSFYIDLNKKIDSLIDNLLIYNYNMNKYEDPDINFYLNKCFYLKLKNFGDNIGVKINPIQSENNFKPSQKINYNSIKDDIDYPSEEEINKIQKKHKKNENEIYNNEMFYYNIEELDLADELNKSDYFLIIDNINIMSEKLLKKLNYFLQNNECQIKCFKKTNFDEILIFWIKIYKNIYLIYIILLN